MLRHGWPDAGLAVLGFKALGQLAEPAVPDLVLLLDDADESLRNAAIQALGYIGPPARAAVPALLDELRIGNLTALDSLGSIGPAAAEAAPVILAELEQLEGERVQPWIIALGKVGSDSAVPFLIEFLRRQDEKARGAGGGQTSLFLRQRAVEALGRIGPPARRAVPFLLELLTREEGGSLVSVYFKLATIQALAGIGPDASEAVPVLEEITRSEKYKNSQLPQFASAALNKIQRRENQNF
jgi:HEAT repeat protein